MKYEIGSRIRKYREGRGINQKQLAQMIGVSNSRISNWEQGLNRPDADILASICRALEVSPSQLLDVNLAPNELSEQEQKVLQAYRDKPELHSAIHILLGLQSEN
ncbi:MAG: helix-turn-helix transcriptional regulator [Ruminococcaceae bacterium]|nr:helix-turn-helix transcriptional regulator [Oscillospiraceae bacterium]MBQ3214585.1 helix-turn-helix transcriptional regulator [Oscillospiraceae bacterium]